MMEPLRGIDSRIHLTNWDPSSRLRGIRDDSDMVVVWEEAAIRKHHFVNTGRSGVNRRFFPPSTKNARHSERSEESV